MNNRNGFSFMHNIQYYELSGKQTLALVNYQPSPELKVFSIRGTLINKNHFLSAKHLVPGKR